MSARLSTLLLLLAFPGITLSQEPDVAPYPDDAYPEPEVILEEDRMPEAQAEGEAYPEPEVIQDEPDQADEPGPEVLRGTEPAGDLPARVARLSFLEGDVAFQGEDSRAPEEVVLNQPLSTGDRLLTENNSKAELTLGVAAVRVDERSDISVSALDENRVSFELNSGTLSVHVRELRPGERFDIQTPNSTIRLLQPGEYRIEAAGDGSTLLAVRGGGDAEIDSGTGEGPVRVQDLQQARLGPGERLAAFQEMGRRDPFEEWSRDRERELTARVSERYVSRDVVGYEDLDRHGTWYSERDYGYVWVPSRVSIGWEPYRFGRWRWLSHWGWTWIDDSPWGFAPFHYGRWHLIRDRWCWVPPPRFHHKRHHWHPGYHHSRPPRPWKGYAHRDHRFSRDAFVRNGIRDGIARGADRYRGGNYDGRYRTRPELGRPNVGSISPPSRAERPDYRRGTEPRLSAGDRDRWVRPDRPGGRYLRNEGRSDRNDRYRERPRLGKPDLDGRPHDRPRIDRPRVDRPGYDRPHIDRPRVDRPSYDRPRNDRPRVDRPDYDRPRYDRPRVDRPNNDGRHHERPRYDRPRVDTPRSTPRPWSDGGGRSMRSGGEGRVHSAPQRSSGGGDRGGDRGGGRYHGRGNGRIN
jgi:hypothetical protein